MSKLKPPNNRLTLELNGYTLEVYRLRDDPGNFMLVYTGENAPENCIMGRKAFEKFIPSITSGLELTVALLFLVDKPNPAGKTLCLPSNKSPI